MSFIAQIIIMIGNCESFREGKMAHAPNRSEWKWFHWVSQVWAVWLCVVHENCRQFADCCRKDRLQLRNYYYNTVHALLRFHCLEWIRIAYPTWIIKRYSSSRFAICIAPTVLTPRHAQTMTFSTSESGTLCTRSNIWVPANALYSSNIASIVFATVKFSPMAKLVRTESVSDAMQQCQERKTNEALLCHSFNLHTVPADILCVGENFVQKLAANICFSSNLLQWPYWQCKQNAKNTTRTMNKWWLLVTCGFRKLSDCE